MWLILLIIKQNIFRHRVWYTEHRRFLVRLVVKQGREITMLIECQSGSQFKTFLFLLQHYSSCDRVDTSGWIFLANSMVRVAGSQRYMEEGV